MPGLGRGGYFCHDAMPAACAYVKFVNPVNNNGDFTGDDVDDAVDDGPLQGVARPFGEVVGLHGTVGRKDGGLASEWGMAGAAMSASVRLGGVAASRGGSDRGLTLVFDWYGGSLVAVVVETCAGETRYGSS